MDLNYIKPGAFLLSLKTIEQEFRENSRHLISLVLELVDNFNPVGDWIHSQLKRIYEEEGKYY